MSWLHDLESHYLALGVGTNLDAYHRTRIVHRILVSGPRSQYMIYTVSMDSFTYVGHMHMSYASVSLCKPCIYVMESIQDARAMLKENEIYLNPKPKARGGIFRSQWHPGRMGP